MEIVLDGTSLRIEKYVLGKWSTNAYILRCAETGVSVLVDAPPEAASIVECKKENNLKYILLTHNHIDHIEGLPGLRAKTSAPLAIHAADNDGRLPFHPEKLLTDVDTICFGKQIIEVIHTPGHTPGSLCFKIGDYLISGDTLFPGGPGRTSSPAAFQQIIRSITGKLLNLSPETRIFPGHGPATVLKEEIEQIKIFSSRSHPPGLSGDVLWLS
jgi:hydroxyacylglutathione hydrolase